MPVDFVARWLSFLGKLILIAAHAEDAEDDEKTFLSLRVGLVTIIGILFVVPTIISVVPGSKTLLGGSASADTIIPSLTPLALLLGLALGLISFLGFLYNVRVHYRFGIWLLPVSYGIVVEALWKSFPQYFAGRSSLLQWGAVGLLLLVLPMFYPVAAMRENRLNLAVHALFRLLRDPLVGFSALVCLLGWLFWIPYTLRTQWIPYQQVHFWVLPLQAMPYAAPLFAVGLYGRGSAAGANALKRIRHDFAVWRVPVVYYLLAIFLLPLMRFALLAVLHLDMGRSWDTAVYGICLALVMGFSLGTVFRGYLLNQCLRRWSPLTASMVVGVVFAVYVRVMLMTNANFSTSFALQDVPMYLGFSIVLAGFYHRTGSLLLASLLETTVQLTRLDLTVILAPGAPTWYIFILVFAVVPAMLILYVERNWFFGREHRPAPGLEKAG